MIDLKTAAAAFKRYFPSVSVGVPAPPSLPTPHYEDTALVRAICSQLEHTRYLPPDAITDLDIALAVEEALAQDGFAVISETIERKWADDTINELHALRTAGHSVEDAKFYANEHMMDFLDAIGHEAVGKAWWHLPTYVIEHNTKAGINPAAKVEQ